MPPHQSVGSSRSGATGSGGSSSSADNAVAVGRRFACCVGGSSRDDLEKMPWQTGIIRAATETAIAHADQQFCVEWDGKDPTRDYEWIYLHDTPEEDRYDNISGGNYSCFVVEDRLMWCDTDKLANGAGSPSKSKAHSTSSSRVFRPVLTFRVLLDKLDYNNKSRVPVQLLAENALSFVSKDVINSFPVQQHQTSLNIKGDVVAVSKDHQIAINHWFDVRRNQHKLIMEKDKHLIGQGVQVYWKDGASKRWYSGCLKAFGKKDDTVTVMDYNVMQDRKVDPRLEEIQIQKDHGRSALTAVTSSSPTPGGVATTSSGRRSRRPTAADGEIIGKSLADNVQEDEEEGEEEEEAMPVKKKPGRKPKAAAQETSLIKDSAAAGTTKPTGAKRGRKPKIVAAIITHSPTPPTPPVAALSKRGAKARDNDSGQSEPVVKRPRGRPPAKKAAVAAKPVGRPRGRPAKSKASKAVSSGEEEEEEEREAVSEDDDDEEPLALARDDSEPESEEEEEQQSWGLAQFSAASRKPVKPSELVQPSLTAPAPVAPAKRKAKSPTPPPQASKSLPLKKRVQKRADSDVEMPSETEAVLDEKKAVDVPAAPVKRKPGRPRKNPDEPVTKRKQSSAATTKQRNASPPDGNAGRTGTARQKKTYVSYAEDEEEEEAAHVALLEAAAPSVKGRSGPKIEEKGKSPKKEEILEKVKEISPPLVMPPVVAPKKRGRKKASEIAALAAAAAEQMQVSVMSAEPVEVKKAGEAPKETARVPETSVPQVEKSSLKSALASGPAGMTPSQLQATWQQAAAKATPPVPVSQPVEPVAPKKMARVAGQPQGNPVDHHSRESSNDLHRNEPASFHPRPVDRPPHTPVVAAFASGGGGTPHTADLYSHLAGPPLQPQPAQQPMRYHTPPYHSQYNYPPGAGGQQATPQQNAQASQPHAHSQARVPPHQAASTVAPSPSPFRATTTPSPFVPRNAPVGNPQQQQSPAASVASQGQGQGGYATAYNQHQTSQQNQQQYSAGAVLAGAYGAPAFYYQPGMGGAAGFGGGGMMYGAGNAAGVPAMYSMPFTNQAGQIDATNAAFLYPFMAQIRPDNDQYNRMVQQAAAAQQANSRGAVRSTATSPDLRPSSANPLTGVITGAMQALHNFQIPSPPLTSSTFANFNMGLSSGYTTPSTSTSSDSHSARPNATASPLNSHHHHQYSQPQTQPRLSSALPSQMRSNTPQDHHDRVQSSTMRSPPPQTRNQAPPVAVSMPPGAYPLPVAAAATVHKPMEKERASPKTSSRHSPKMLPEVPVTTEKESKKSKKKSPSPKDATRSSVSVPASIPVQSSGVSASKASVAGEPCPLAMLSSIATSMMPVETTAPPVTHQAEVPPEQSAPSVKPAETPMTDIVESPGAESDVARSIANGLACPGMSEPLQPVKDHSGSGPAAPTSPREPFAPSSPQPAPVAELALAQGTSLLSDPISADGASSVPSPFALPEIRESSPDAAATSHTVPEVHASPHVPEKSTGIVSYPNSDEEEDERPRLTICESDDSIAHPAAVPETSASPVAAVTVTETVVQSALIVDNQAKELTEVRERTIFLDSTPSEKSVEQLEIQPQAEPAAPQDPVVPEDEASLKCIPVVEEPEFDHQLLFHFADNTDWHPLDESDEFNEYVLDGTIMNEEEISRCLSHPKLLARDRNVAPAAPAPAARQDFRNSENENLATGKRICSQASSTVVDRAEKRKKKMGLFVQEKDCIMWRYGKDGRAMDIPLCMDCFCLEAAGRKHYGRSVQDSVNRSTCRFRGSQLRVLKCCGESMRVSSLVKEQVKSKALLDEKMLWYADESGSNGAPPPPCSAADAHYIVSRVRPVLEKILDQEKSFVPNVYDREGAFLKTLPKGERESCDVCRTSIFNVHFVCAWCGFAVCGMCKKEGKLINESDEDRKSIHARKKSYENLCCSDGVRREIPRTKAGWPVCCSNPTKSLPVRMEKKDFAASDLWTKDYPHDLKACRIIPSEAVGELQRIMKQMPTETGPDPPPKTEAESDQARILAWIPQDQSEESVQVFRSAWTKGHPVMVSGINGRLSRREIWTPAWFESAFGQQRVSLVDCLDKSQPNVSGPTTHADFWKGFTTYQDRMKNDNGESRLLKIKDWPTKAAFKDTLPIHHADVMSALPINSYSNLDGLFNLTTYLPAHFNPPDLGPKMYIAYGSVGHPKHATTNLHVDISDAVNVMVHVSRPSGPEAQAALNSEKDELAKLDLDEATLNRVTQGQVPGAVWQIYRPCDAPLIRDFLRRCRRDRNSTFQDDPIHCQLEFLDASLRQQLLERHKVRGWDIVQFEGDAIFIPAGAPHQVWNIHSCIKFAEDFVSPEHLAHCLDLTNEFRKLPDDYRNKQDKLQVKSILYQTMKTLLPVALPKAD